MEPVFLMLILVVIACVLVLTVYIITSLTKLNRFLDEFQKSAENINKTTDQIESFVQKFVPFLMSSLATVESVKKGLELFFEGKRKSKTKK